MNQQKKPWIFGKNISQYKHLDLEENSDFENDVKIILDNNDILNIDLSAKLMKTTQDFSNIESQKTSFSQDSHFFTLKKTCMQKKKMN